ncbi:hypothetical protein D3C75_658990 [compost metagenome]
MAFTPCDAMETVTVLEVVDEALLLGHAPELATRYDVDLFSFQHGEVVAAFHTLVHCIYADNGCTVTARSVGYAMDPFHEG